MLSHPKETVVGFKSQPAAPNSPAGTRNRSGRCAMTARLGKLIRLLSSDRPGEVVAAAGAINRALQAAGLDIHRLADVVERSPLVPGQTPPAPRDDGTNDYGAPCAASAPATTRC